MARAVHAAAMVVGLLPFVAAVGGELTGASRYTPQRLHGVSVSACGALSVDGLGMLSSSFNGAELAFSLAPPAASACSWSIEVDRSKEAAGVTVVTGRSKKLVGLSVARTYTSEAVKSGVPYASYARVRVEDTFATNNHDTVGVYVNNSFAFAAAEAASEWSTASRIFLYGALEAAPWTVCTTNQVRGTQGNPSAYASIAAHNGTGRQLGAVGIMAFDSVLRAHATLSHTAVSPCTSVGVSPHIALVDPYLVLQPRMAYTASWALYINRTAGERPTRRQHGGQNILRWNSDDWDFVNQLRQDLAVTNITVPG